MTWKPLPYRLDFIVWEGTLQEAKGWKVLKTLCSCCAYVPQDWPSCMSYECFISVKRQHDQSNPNKRNLLIVDLSTVLEG